MLLKRLNNKEQKASIHKCAFFFWSPTYKIFPVDLKITQATFPATVCCKICAEGWSKGSVSCWHKHGIFLHTRLHTDTYMQHKKIQPEVIYSKITDLASIWWTTVFLCLNSHSLLSQHALLISHKKQESTYKLAQHHIMPHRGTGRHSLPRVCNLTFHSPLQHVERSNEQ